MRFVSRVVTSLIPALSIASLIEDGWNGVLNWYGFFEDFLSQYIIFRDIFFYYWLDLDLPEWVADLLIIWGVLSYYTILLIPYIYKRIGIWFDKSKTFFDYSMDLATSISIILVTITFTPIMYLWFNLYGIGMLMKHTRNYLLFRKEIGLGVIQSRHEEDVKQYFRGNFNTASKTLIMSLAPILTFVVMLFANYSVGYLFY